MSGWRDELVQAIKSKAEREAEEAERKRKRLVAALAVADEAMSLAKDAVAFAHEQLTSKQQAAKLTEANGGLNLSLHDFQVSVELNRAEAVLKISYNDGRPREFDFANERHLSPKDVEEYVGRRAVEMARAAQKAQPW